MCALTVYERGGTKVFGLRSKYSKCCVMCVCVRVCTLSKIPL